MLIRATLAPFDDLWNYSGEACAKIDFVAATAEAYRIAADLARRLIAYRIEHNLTRVQLGKKAGMSYSVIFGHERGYRAVALYAGGDRQNSWVRSTACRSSREGQERG